MKKSKWQTHEDERRGGAPRGGIPRSSSEVPDKEGAKGVML